MPRPRTPVYASDGPVLDFQITYSPKAWAEERNSWRTVIQLNLVRNINNILDMLAEEMVSTAPSKPTTATPPLIADGGSDDEDDVDAPSTSTAPLSSTAPLRFTDHHALLKLRLTPLRELQRDLEETLGVSLAEDVEHPLQRGSSARRSPTGRTSQEAFIRSHTSWKSKLRAGGEGTPDGIARKHRVSRAREAVEILAGCRDDIRAVWADPLVQEMLRRRRFVIESIPGL